LGPGSGNACAEFFVNDGEGYTLQVSVVDDIHRMAVPYADEVAQEKSDDAVWPFDLLVERGDVHRGKQQ
jgi:hypothetical protein